MALNDIIVPKEGASGVLNEVVLTPAQIGAASTTHAHAIADVTNLQTTLDGKQASGSYAESSHVHPIATTGAAGFLSSSDHIKLLTIQTGAEVNVNADWNATTGDAQILNRPNINMTVDGNGGTAGSINAGSTFGGTSGTLTLGAGYSGVGGNITTSGGFNGVGGSIDTRGIYNGVGGSIDTSASYDAVGGSITTKEGGGSINTTGTGSIQLGVSGTRTTLTGTATANRSIALPNNSGTLALINHTIAVGFVLN
jgi:hypothetical protein